MYFEHQCLISPSPVCKISFTEPKSPFLTQFDDIDSGTICNVTTINNDECLVNRCYCTHVERVALGNVVDLGWVNLGNTAFSHPIHLHGYHFRVLAQIQVSYVLDSRGRQVLHQR